MLPVLENMPLIIAAVFI